MVSDSDAISLVDARMVGSEICTDAIVVVTNTPFNIFDFIIIEVFH